MHIAALNKCDIANGEGIRVSLFVSGCDRACPGCFNQKAWNYEYGTPYNDDVLATLLEYLGRPWVSGLTILGGEPLAPRNQEEVANIMKAVKAAYPSKTIWVYTGYTFEELLSMETEAYTEYLPTIWEHLDVLVDGPYVEALRDPSLRFKGSSNQRIIDLAATYEKQEIVTL